MALEGRGLARNTVRSYREMAAHALSAPIAHKRLDALTPLDFQALLQDVGRGRSPRTVQYVRAVLRKALQEAADLGLLLANPVVKVRAPRVPRKELRAPTPDEAARLKSSSLRRRGVGRREHDGIPTPPASQQADPIRPIVRHRRQQHVAVTRQGRVPAGQGVAPQGGDPHQQVGPRQDPIARGSGRSPRRDDRPGLRGTGSPGASAGRSAPGTRRGGPPPRRRGRAG